MPFKHRGKCNTRANSQINVYNFLTVEFRRRWMTYSRTKREHRNWGVYTRHSDYLSKTDLHVLHTVEWATGTALGIGNHLKRGRLYLAWRYTFMVARLNNERSSRRKGDVSRGFSDSTFKKKKGRNTRWMKKDEPSEWCETCLHAQLMGVGALGWWTSRRLISSIASALRSLELNNNIYTIN